MANKKLNQLPAAPEVNLTDLLALGNPANGALRKITVAQLLAAISKPPKLMVSGDDLNDDNEYVDADYAGVDVLVFANGWSRFMVQGDEYDVLPGGGFAILVDAEYSADDKFVIIPK